MGNDLYWHNLREHADKMYKFQQRKLNYSGSGDCLSLSLMFLKEALGSNPASMLPRFDHRAGTLGNEHSANEPTIALAQRFSRERGNTGGIDYVERSIGIVQMPVQRPVSVETELFTGQARSGNDSIINMIVRAVDYLPVGYGVLIIVNMISNSGTIGHTWSFVRTHANRIMFFDANIGTYLIRDIIPFMKELYGGYKEFGYHSTTLYGQDESVHDAWYRVYMR